MVGYRFEICRLNFDMITEYLYIVFSELMQSKYSK